jgi:hypothetical protein
MQCLWDPQCLTDVERRVDRLTPELRPRWGRLTPHAMVCHLSDALRITLGDISLAPVRSPLRHPPLKWLVIYVLPVPRGINSPDGFFTTAPTEWEADRAQLSELLARGATHPAEEPWGVSPLFGTLSKQQWGILNYKHADHHLRQFGVWGRAHPRLDRLAVTFGAARPLYCWMVRDARAKQQAGATPGLPATGRPPARPAARPLPAGAR